MQRNGRHGLSYASQLALWKKLTVGSRLADWLLRGTACPLHPNAQETMQHALLHCKFLHPAFFIVQQCISPVLLSEGSTESVLYELTALSVTSLLRLLYWSGVRTNWMI